MLANTYSTNCPYPLCPPPTDCNGTVNGLAMLDDCGVCQLAYLYNTVTHIPTFITDTNGLQISPTQSLVLPNSVTNPLWNASCKGCTDSSAVNFDSTAIIDDGSCIQSIQGCTDSTAINYNSLANIDDGSCLYSSSDCYGIANGTAVLDSCGVCNQAYLYTYSTHLVSFVSNANILVPGINYNPATTLLVRPGDPGDRYWNSTCSGCTLSLIHI